MTLFSETILRFCARDQGRTGDLFLFREALYQLSYPSKAIFGFHLKLLGKYTGFIEKFNPLMIPGTVSFG